MIKVSVLYPHRPDAKFDFDYYCRRHIPMVRDRLGEACHGIAVDKGLAGEAGAPPAQVAMAHLYFESVAAFQKAFAPHDAEISGDVPNYTNIEPVLVISEVLINATRSQTGELRLHGA